MVAILKQLKGRVVMIYMRSSGLLISVDRNGFKGEKIKKKGKQQNQVYKRV